MKKLQLFDQRHGLPPFQKCQFWLLVKYMFILCKNACFLTTPWPNTFSACIWIKRNVKKVKNFDQHPGLNPFGKMPFCAFLHRRFRFSERLVCYIKRRKSFFLDLFSGFMTWEYRGYGGLQWVTKGDRGWQGVTGGYKLLQGVTKGYWELQGVTTGYRGLRRIIETFF